MSLPSRDADASNSLADGELSELGRARAEAVLRSGCLDALRVALVGAGYTVTTVRNRAHATDRLWIEPKRPCEETRAALTVWCERFDDGWWFIRAHPARRLSRVDELDDAVRKIATEL